MARTKTVRRAAAVAAACAALAIACGACGSASAARVTPAPRTEATRATAALLASGATDLVSPRLGIVALGPGSPSATIEGAQLVVTTNFGRTFTDIGPNTGGQTLPDSVFFLDRQHGWFATYSVQNLAETIYRTSDGGLKWQAFAAPGHNLAAGSGDSLQFLTPAKGWLVDVVATAPAEHLYRTTNGGRSWRKVSLGAPSGSAAGLPSAFGRTIVEPVTLGAGGTASLSTYISTNGGTTWSRALTLKDAASPSCSGPLPTSYPALTAGWLAAFLNHHAVVYTTLAKGRAWAPHVTPAPAARQDCGPYQITAVAGGKAWLITAGPAGSDAPRIYATTTDGLTWRRIDLAAAAAGSPAVHQATSRAQGGSGAGSRG
jgi:photosystem II stability/assembly factor-like uncharacterized protein